MMDAILPEFDREMAITRRLLERVPEEKFDWKPHAKSMSLGGLGTHIANLVRWGTITLTQLEFDIASAPSTPQAASRGDLLDMFDRNVATTHITFEGKTDGELMVIWALKNERETMFTMPRVAVLRSFLMNHIIHHRGQLTVYLRLNDVPLPPTYGPTADEAI